MSDGKKGYSSRWQDHPGYKTVVDMKSEKGILPEQTEDGDLGDGQGNMESMWPVELSQTREKERALPLPSNHDKKRDKHIGPTYFNKPRKSPDRTLPEPGEEYGHPTKYDYNFPTRRKNVSGADDEEEEDTEEVPESAGMDSTIDNLIEMMGAVNPFPSPADRQRNQGGSADRYSEQYYRQHPQIRQRAKRKYDTELKRSPKLKRKKKKYNDNPSRYERRGLGVSTPAERTRKWREDQSMSTDSVIKKHDRSQELEQNQRSRRNMQAGLEALAEAFELLGLEQTAGNWPLNWNTTVKKTAPPGGLQRNFDPENSGGTGTPRNDPGAQKGVSLRAPDLDEKHQPGLFTQHEPPAAGEINTPTTNNPTDGSGKVIPMSYYTDLVNNTQEVADGRQDNYLHNNNFEVKQAHDKVAITLTELLKRVDKKIKIRAKERPATLLRTDTKNWIWHWKSGSHTVRVQAFKRGRAENLSKLNLRISCSCPFWQWWGPEHWASKADYQKGALRGTGAYPKVRDPAHWRPICKHAYAVLEKSQRFFVRPSKSPLKKLGARFFVDSPDAIEIVLVDKPSKARVAHAYLQRELIRRVVARYLERKRKS